MGLSLRVGSAEDNGINKPPISHNQPIINSSLTKNVACQVSASYKKTLTLDLEVIQYGKIMEDWNPYQS